MAKRNGGTRKNGKSNGSTPPAEQQKQEDGWVPPTMQDAGQQRLPDGTFAPHEPTDQARKQVETMAGLGITDDDIAVILGISVDTLRQYYNEEKRRGTANAKVRIYMKTYQLALGGDRTMLIWWEKTRGGMSEKQQLDVNVTDTRTPEEIESEEQIRTGKILSIVDQVRKRKAGAA